MPQVCRVCAHPKTKDIEDDIVNGMAIAAVARRYNLGQDSVRYHADNHLSYKLVQAVQRENSNHADGILTGIKDLLDRTKDIIDSAERKNQKRLALDAIKEARSTYELLSKIAVKLEEYRRQEEDKETSMLEDQIARGVKALSDDELHAFTQLVAKIHAAEPEHTLDPISQRVVETLGRGNQSLLDEKPTIRRKARRQVPDTAQTPNDLVLEWEDMEELELEDLEDGTIPSELTDPEWLRDDRRRRHY